MRWFVSQQIWLKDILVGNLGVTGKLCRILTPLFAEMPKGHRVFSIPKHPLLAQFPALFCLLRATLLSSLPFMWDAEFPMH